MCSLGRKQWPRNGITGLVFILSVQSLIHSVLDIRMYASEKQQNSLNTLKLLVISNQRPSERLSC